jgi:hypothetical protein
MGKSDSFSNGGAGIGLEMRIELLISANGAFNTGACWEPGGDNGTPYDSLAVDVPGSGILRRMVHYPGGFQYLYSGPSEGSWIWDSRYDEICGYRDISQKDIWCGTGVSTDGPFHRIIGPDTLALEFGIKDRSSFLSLVTSVQVSYPMQSGWNMVSVPVTVNDLRKSALYPTAVSPAYAFQPITGYMTRDTLFNGVGYWLKFEFGQSVSTVGQLIPVDTIDVYAGWNMVGTISNPVDTNTIVSIPPGLRGSSWYGYGVTGYVPVTQLIPGQGYWVRANSAGQFVLANPLLARP